LILWSVEKIADEYKYLFKHVKGEVSQDLLNYYDDTIGFVEDIYKLYSKFDIKLFSKIVKAKKALTKKGEELLGKETKLAHHLLNVVSISFDMVGNIIAKQYSE